MIAGVRSIQKAIESGDLTLAIVYTAEILPSIANKPVSHQLIHACVLAACPVHGHGSLQELAYALRADRPQFRLRAIETVRNLAMAIDTLDVYTMQRMVHRIRSAAPATSRSDLTAVLSGLIHGPDPDDADSADTLFANLSKLLPRKFDA